MRKAKCLLVSFLLIFSCFRFVGVKSELESNTEDIPKLTQADLNYVWLESKGSQTLGYNTLKVVNSYVGQTLTENIEIRNKTKETLNYTLTTELMDCENKEVWQDGDNLAMKLSTDKVSLKAGEKKQVPVTIQVLKNHSGNAYFRIYVVPSKGKKEFVLLNICQFDTKAEVMTTKPPVMFKTLSEALKNKTKLGRLIRKPDKTFLIYRNIYLFCFDTKTGKFSWYYNNKTSIIDITIYEGFIFTQNLEKIIISTGKLCTHPKDFKKEFDLTLQNDIDYILNNISFINNGIVCVDVSDNSEGGPVKNLLIKHNTFDSIINFYFRLNNYYVYAHNSECLLIFIKGVEMTPNKFYVLNILSKKNILEEIPYFSTKWIKEKKVLILNDPLRQLTVIDMQTIKPYFEIKNSYIRYTVDGNIIYYIDETQTGAYDYSYKKSVWNLKGKGYPIAIPVLDNNRQYVYIADCIINPNNTTNQEKYYLRCFKFDSKTGKQLWKSVFDENGDYLYDPWFDNKIITEKDKVTISLENRSWYYLRASDGKPWK